MRFAKLLFFVALAASHVSSYTLEDTEEAADDDQERGEESSKPAEVAAGPVKEVLRVLKALAKRVDVRSRKEDALFKEFGHYCSKGSSSLEKSLKESQLELPQLQLQIAEATRKRQALLEELKARGGSASHGQSISTAWPSTKACRGWLLGQAPIATSPDDYRSCEIMMLEGVNKDLSELNAAEAKRKAVFEAMHMAAPHVAEGTKRVKKGLPAMLKGGVIMDVMNKEQAKIAEEAGACAVMALERIPADIRQSKGVARMSDPKMIKDAKCRIGHFAESQVLKPGFLVGRLWSRHSREAIGVDCIDESEVLTVADEGNQSHRGNHVNKNNFKAWSGVEAVELEIASMVPFVCGCRNLGEALRRIAEGASMIRTKGEAGTGDVVEAVRHIRTLHKEMRMVQMMDDDELFTYVTWPARLIGIGSWGGHQ
eukprot:Skav217891  [mRNA]  locus=scaffold67:345448:361665:+ [translate_table: standard]